MEDDVTAYAEYANGATGVFITTTGEYPGTNRLEISGDKGKLVIEGSSMKFWKNKTPERQWTVECPNGFEGPGCEMIDVDYSEFKMEKEQHRGCLLYTSALISVFFPIALSKRLHRTKSPRRSDADRRPGNTLSRAAQN